MKQLIRHLILYIIGGFSYYLLECLWRGYSHISMFALGGLCFLLIGLVKKYYLKSGKNILKELFIYCLIITSLELVFGLLLNVKIGLEIWDYSDLKFNFMGQISLAYSILWFFLSYLIILLYEYLLYWVFGEEKPNYRFI